MYTLLETDTSFSSGATNQASALPDVDPYPPITIDNVTDQVGLVREFFLKKLHDNQERPLVEDDDLPLKQRMPKPRLPPTGKITSPRKRPFKEPGPGKGHPRKKMKLNDGDAVKISENEVANAGPSGSAENLAGDPTKMVKGGASTPQQLPNGEPMSREPSRAGEGGSSTNNPIAVPTPTNDRPLTNGVIPAKLLNHVDMSIPLPQPLEKTDRKESNGNSLPSPESLSASG